MGPRRKRLSGLATICLLIGFGSLLSVLNGCGGGSSKTSPPIANAGGPYSGIIGQAVNFDGSKSSAPSGQTLIYAWNFGDGATGSGTSPSHTYTKAGSFTVSLVVTDSKGVTGSATATATISSGVTASTGGPYSGTANQAIAFDGSRSTGPSGQTLTYAWNFGDNSTGTGVTTSHAYTASGTFTVSLTVSDGVGGSDTATTTATISASTSPTISGFSPSSGTVGTVVTVTGTNLTQSGAPVPQVILSQQGGGTVEAPVSSYSASSLTFVIPAAAATGVFSVDIGLVSLSSVTPLTVTSSSSFTLSASPSTATLLPGQSVAIAVTLTSTNGFEGIAALSVSGLPTGISASFKPASLAVGQLSTLLLSAPAGQASATASLTITGTAALNDQTLTQSATASLQVGSVSTSFLGRTVVDDAREEPIAGVTVQFTGKDDKGNSTGCSGETVSDAGGNFVLANLPMACTGPQLIAYNGATATSPAGKYAGVNLSYTLVSGQVVASPVLVHLPRIDNAETVQVQQNSATDQIFYFHSIPGLKVTVYAGTTLSLDDGTQPNPFPLVAIQIPIDRLPDAIPTSGMLTPFIVAFQPANAVASQPVAVNFPNPLATAPGTPVTFVTLDPTHGYMVTYGTGTVSGDGTEFVADPDPAHPGHAFGLVHFDWHGPSTGPPSVVNPADCACQGPKVGGPVDLASGIVFYTNTDLSVSSARGSIGIHRYYRTLASYNGPFGRGTSFEYGYALNTLSLISGKSTTITLGVPDGNQYLLSKQPNGTFSNAIAPSLRGAVLTANVPSGPYTLTWTDGTVYTFTVNTSTGNAGAFLTSITDLNGNVTTITRSTTNPQQIQSVTDPVGRSILLTYGSNGMVSKATDPIGRTVSYTYYPSGTLQTFTDANGGKTNYTYDSSNNLATITDPRGVMTEQNTYNEIFDGRVMQQVEADGGTYNFSYTLLNPATNPGVPTSPVLQTVVTDPLGNQTTYRFDPQGYMVSATDAIGQTRTLTRDPAHSNLVSAYAGLGVCPVCGDPGAGNVSYTYDASGNTLTYTDGMGNTTTFTYDTRFNKVNSVTDARNDTTRIAYDARGNATSVTDADVNTTQLVYDGFGELTQVIDALGNKTQIGWDAYGNATSVTDALGNVTQLTYDAVSRLTQTIDALNRKSLTAYDLLNRVSSQTDPLGNKVAFGYDQIGNLTTFTDARNNVTHYDYYPAGQLMDRISPLGAKESYMYDTDSNLTQYTDRRSQLSTFKYDALNRLIQETYPDATVTRSYDAQSRLQNVNDSQGGIFGFTYDAAGRLLSQDEPTGVVQYTRDALGRVATRQVAGQATVTYGYDPAGNLLSAATPSIGVSYAYDVRNLPKTLTRTNGVVTSFSFDALGQLLSLVHSNGTTALNTIKYTYDASGQRSVVANDISQPLITQSATGSVDAANELNPFGATTYTYDKNGNRLAESGPNGTLTYAWDGRNRLASITDASGDKTAMQYDFARNLLVLSQTTGATNSQQSFAVDSLTNVVSLSASSGGVFSLLTGLGIDSHFASIDSGGNAQFGIMDALGSITGVTDATGKLASQFKYEPYGQMTGTIAAGYPFGFTGRVPVLGGVNYFRNRYYDAAAGRFVSEDPIDISGGANLDAYADDNPIDGSDPYGLINKARSFGTLLKRVAGKKLLSNALTADVDFISDRIDSLFSIDQKWDLLGDSISCLTHDPLYGNIIKIAHSSYETVKDISSFAETLPIVIGAAALGPVGIVGAVVIGGPILYFEVSQTLEHAQRFGNDLGNLISGKAPNCGCMHP